MLIVGVFHGLGNQMFQYAFYLSLKLKGYDVYLDNKLEWLGYKKAHNGYELDKVFNINNVFISEEKRKYYKGWSGILGKIQRKLIKNDKLYIKRSPIEDNIKYYPEVFNFNNKLLISGWQSEKYFYDIKKDIKNAFCFKQTLDDKNLKLAKEMKKENSISVHIRRGDYLKDKYFYGVCDKNYYDKAINASTYPELVSAFHGTPYEEVLSGFSLESIASEGLFPLEIALDHMWFKHLGEGIKKLTGQDRKTAEAIYTVDVDLKNILMITRYSYSYHLSPAELKKVMIPMGYIAREAEKSGALSSEDPIAVLSGIVRHHYPQISEEIARIRRTADDLTTVEENNREIVLIEAYLGERRKKEYKKILMGDPFSIGVVLAYFFLCLQEDGNLRAILSGKYYGQSEAKIREGLGL